MVKDGLLWWWYKKSVDHERTLQLVIPLALQEKLLKDLHEDVLAGHLGMDKTLSRLKDCFCWPGHYNHVENWCRNCAKCARRKTPVPNTRAPLQSIKAGYPMQIVATDILGPFPESENENNYILVVGNYLTHWVEVYGIHNQEAVTDANKITNGFSFVSSQWSSCILITE